jgi:hypothetical protein
MHTHSHFPLVRFSRFAEIIICFIIFAFLYGCQSIRNATVPATPVEVQVSPADPLTEKPITECVLLPDVELFIDPLSENSVHLKITGLVPNEPVYTIFSSEFEEKEKSTSCCPGEVADVNGVYEYKVGLRGLNSDAEFKEWHVQVVHSRGSTCKDFVLP